MTKKDRVQFKFLIPIELKNQLEELAEANHRSLTGEILARLEDSVRTTVTLNHLLAMNSEDLKKLLEQLLVNKKQ
ncbi:MULTISPECIES: Arc family DNA-binding protein [unclassified Bartonella]|uniref:Arc family DNA-binding protein n=1 Tax=unclassified Bartonella TaxID=2645622 RepID=UPI0035CFA6D7